MSLAACVLKKQQQQHAGGCRGRGRVKQQQHDPKKEKHRTPPRAASGPLCGGGVPSSHPSLAVLEHFSRSTWSAVIKTAHPGAGPGS